jgi:hypothetical protein
MVHRLTVLLRSQVCCGAAATPGVPGFYDRFVPPGLIGLLVAMQPGNLAQMGNIAGMDHTNTKWWVRLKQGRSHNRVLRNRGRHSREQSLKPLQATRAQGRDQERLRLPRSNLRHVTLLRIHSLLLCDSSQQRTVQQTTPAKLLQ